MHDESVDTVEADSEEIPTLEDELAFQREAMEMMEESRPEEEMYFQVAGTDHIVASFGELRQLQADGIPLEYVNYNRAMYCLNKQEAEKRKLSKRRARNKKARAARRRNRGR